MDINGDDANADTIAVIGEVGEVDEVNSGKDDVNNQIMKKNCE